MCIRDSLFAPDNAQALAETALLALSKRGGDEESAMLDRALDFVRTERSWEAVGARYLPVYERLIRASQS